EGPQRPAREEVHGQHLPTAEIRMRARDAELARWIEVLAKHQQVVQLGSKVELSEQTRLELLDDRRHAEQLHLVDRRLEHLRSQVEQVEIAAHQLLNTGPLNLDDDLHAFMRARTVSLRD